MEDVKEISQEEYHWYLLYNQNKLIESQNKHLSDRSKLHLLQIIILLAILATLLLTPFMLSKQFEVYDETIIVDSEGSNGIAIYQDGEKHSNDISQTIGEVKKGG